MHVGDKKSLFANSKNNVGDIVLGWRYEFGELAIIGFRHSIKHSDQAEMDLWVIFNEELSTSIMKGVCFAELSKSCCVNMSRYKTA
jgi:hypothetical protein